MADNGIQSANLTTTPKLDEVIGNASGSTRRQKVEQFAVQLASTRPLSLLGLQAPLFALVDDLAVSSTTATSAWVYADGAASGIYAKVAGVWTWALPLPYSFIEAENAGDGTANAIVATTTVPVTDGPLVILPIADTTTGPATVSFNGAAPVMIKTATGNDLPAAALVNGMRVMGVRSANEFRLVTEIVSAAIIAQAQTAADLALARAQQATEMAAFFDPDSFALVGELAAAIVAAKSAANIENGTLADARLSARLQPFCQTITNFNDVVASGWHFIAAAGGSLPVAATAFLAEAVAKDAANIIVTAYSLGSDLATIWQRQKVANAWGGWRRVYRTADEVRLVAGGGFGSLHVRHQVAVNTMGGSLVVGGLNTRPLNTVVANTIAGASLTSNQITLPAGTYEVNVEAPTYYSGFAFTYLHNVTDNARVLRGIQNLIAASSATPGGGGNLRGTFTLAAQKVVEIRHYSSYGRASDGLGTPANAGEPEIYAEAIFKKIA